MTHEEDVIAKIVLKMHADLLTSVVNNLQEFIKESASDSFDKSNTTDFAMVSAAFVMAIKQLDESYHPKMSATIIEMLLNEQKRKMN